MPYDTSERVGQPTSCVWSRVEFANKGWIWVGFWGYHAVYGGWSPPLALVHVGTRFRRVIPTDFQLFPPSTTFAQPMPLAGQPPLDYNVRNRRHWT
jgi:hypothetical protein